MSYLDVELAALSRWEGDVPYAYLDTASPPNVTTAKGYLIASLYVMLTLPWRNAAGLEASSVEITNEWHRVRSMPGGMRASAYESPDGLTLLQADIDALTETMLIQIDRWMPVLIPGYTSMPDGPKVGCLDMGWNLGRERMGLFVHFLHAANQTPPDYGTMASQCARDAADPAFAARNAWTKNLFQNPLAPPEPPL